MKIVWERGAVTVRDVYETLLDAAASPTPRS